jgi:uncharacterized protein
MRDGVTLLADHYVPATSSPAGTLLLRGPYRRDAVPTRTAMGLYAQRGYHVVLQSTRGTFGSGGHFEPGYGEFEDGLDTVAWLRRQPWFTGSFATVGRSYLGFTQWALMADGPQDLAASVVTMGPHDLGAKAWGTGSFALSDFLAWGHGIAGQERGGQLRQFVRAMLTPRRLQPAYRQLPLRVAANEAFGQGAPHFRHWLEHPDPDDQYWQHRRAIVEFDAVR